MVEVKPSIERVKGKTEKRKEIGDLGMDDSFNTLVYKRKERRGAGPEEDSVDKKENGFREGQGFKKQERRAHLHEIDSVFLGKYKVRSSPKV
jgi:hypothetical protein